MLEPYFVIPATFAFILAGIALVISKRIGQMVLIEQMKDDWKYRLPFRLTNNRYVGLSRTCYQLLAIMYYIVKDVFFLALCVYYYILLAFCIVIKWILKKIKRSKKTPVAPKEQNDDTKSESFATSSYDVDDMTIDQKMILAVQELIKLYGQGYVATTAELHAFIQERYKIADSSIIPSDYCYNRINDGITLSKPTLFEHLTRGQYRCLGLNYPYNGDIYHKEQIVGKCKNGVREVYGIPVNEPIVVTNNTRRSRTPSTKLRFEVLSRDKFTCRFCGASPTKDPSVTLHIDHIIPWSKGGETSIDNLQTLCSKCNLGKSDSIVDLDLE